MSILSILQRSIFACDEENNCPGESISALADVCPNCDIDLMVGTSTADLKGFRNEGVMGTPPAARPKKNPLSDDSFGYDFNAADQMTQATWQYGTIEDYEYDGDDLRLRKITGTDEVVYIRDAGGKVLAEYDGSNNLLAEYIYANGHQVAKVEPGAGGDNFRFFHSDQLGTALVITDESGAVTWRGEYYPFGEEYSSDGVPNRYRFTERETDQATGLSYMRARYYNPHLGRFLNWKVTLLFHSTREKSNECLSGILPSGRHGAGHLPSTTITFWWKGTRRDFRRPLRPARFQASLRGAQ